MATNRIAKCNIRIKDLQGNELAYFENVEPKSTSSKYEVADGRYISVDTLEIECTAENLMVIPEE